MKRLLFIMLVFVMGIPQANALWEEKVGNIISKVFPSLTKGGSKLGNVVGALPEEKIVEYSLLSNGVKGTAQLGKELGKLKLSNEVLEDTFIRITVHQGKIPVKEAEEMIGRLSGTNGFQTTLRKIIGNSPIGTAGHLNELRIADAAANNGFKVVSIGEKFNDAVKTALTDIDVILTKGNKTFIMEVKHYAPTTKMPLIKYRADLETLVEYRKQNPNFKAVFSFANKPNDLTYLKALEIEAKKRNVELIFGDAGSVIQQIPFI